MKRYKEVKQIIGYHIAPSNKDKNIQDKGIGKKGVAYIWLDESFANWFRELHEQDGEEMTKWVVDATGLKLSRDPETEDMSDWGSFKTGTFGYGYIYKGVISPDRIMRKE